jgi:phospholipid-binding lipoprotein MlaA
MSVVALTTAMAVAAATVPDGRAPTSGAAFAFELAALEHDPPEVGPAVGSAELSPPLVPPQSTEPPQLTEPAPSTEPVKSTNPAQPTNSASSAQPESQAAAPQDDKTQIIVTGRRPNPDDPLEELNSTSFKVTQTVDKAFVAPVAFAYKKAMPRPIRKGLRNFLQNLGEPIVFLNFMLQLKPGKAAETVGRFAINTALGAAGLVDVAKRKPFNLPHRRNGFANTLGYYGVPPGPYFYLPLVGPTTLRDFIGNRLDLLVLPVALGREFRRPEIAIPVGALSELNSRIEFDDELQEMRATRDPYVAERSYYLRKRQAEIDALHGRGDGTVPVVVPITVPAPASSNPTPAPPTSPVPVPDPPPAPKSTGLLLHQSHTSDLVHGPSIRGLGQYSGVVGDFRDSPLVSDRGSASQWLGALGVAYTL